MHSLTSTWQFLNQHYTLINIGAHSAAAASPSQILHLSQLSPFCVISAKYHFFKKNWIFKKGINYKFKIKQYFDSSFDVDFTNGIKIESLCRNDGEKWELR